MTRHGDITTAAPPAAPEEAPHSGMTIVEAAHFLRVSPTTVARAIDTGDLPARVGANGVTVDGAAILDQLRSPISTSHRRR